ncbi:MAG: alpha/beta hydrolase, partial [Pseudomonadota bacterium]
QDQVVVASEIEKVASEWGGETRLEAIASSQDPYNHVIAGDIMSPDNTDAVSNMIAEWADSVTN